MASLCPPERIDIPAFAIDSMHEPGFCIDRPQGKNFYIFAHFQSYVAIHDLTGTQRFAHNGAILYGPGFRQWYSSGEFEMKHSWFHCNGEGVAACIARYEIPVNRALDLGTFSHLIPFLQDVRRQQLRQERYWEAAVSLHAASFFLELGRAVQQLHDLPMTRYQHQARETLRQVRTTVHSNLAHPWTVAEMADLAHLSASRFTSTYTELFGASPLDDLIDSRIKYACSLLGQTAFTIENIAAQSGFNTPAHFSRLFRKRVGCPPGRYR